MTASRRLLPFVAFQGAMSTMIGFATVVVAGQAGTGGALRFTALLLTVTMACIVVPFRLAAGRHAPGVAAMVRAGFAVPALGLPWAAGRPDLLAAVLGAFLGLTWHARQRLELGLLADDERDAHAARATVRAVLASLAATTAASLLLSLLREAGSDAATVLCRGYALLAAAGAWFAAAPLPASPPMALHRPLALMRQPAFLRGLPLYFLESGLLGVGMVLGATGAVEALGDVGRYGWATSAATVAGALALHRLRRHRDTRNRVGWMGAACIGMVAAQMLLGASVVQPGLYVLHLLVLATVQPFWWASEQVLNQRVLDLDGALADRIAAREVVLWALRMAALAVFAAGTAGLSVRTVLVGGSAVVAVALALEWTLGRAWLQAHPGDADQAGAGSRS